MYYDDAHLTVLFGDIVDKIGIEALGLMDYPIFKEFYRSTLNENIINAFYTREIGFMSIEKFIFHFKAKMKLIMPKYNLLYGIKDTDFNALYNVDMTEIYQHEIKSNGVVVNSSNADSSSDATSKSKINTANKNKNIASSFPNKNMLENDNINSYEYVSGMTQNNIDSNSISEDKNNTNMQSSSDSNTNSDNNMVETYTRKTLGSSAGLPFSKALEQFKDFAKSYELDKEIIRELSPLFLGFYG